MGEHWSTNIEIRADEFHIFLKFIKIIFSDFRRQYHDVTMYCKPRSGMKSHLQLILYPNIKKEMGVTVRSEEL